MLTDAEKLTALFTNLEDYHVQALLALKLIDKHTSEQDMKELSYVLESDPVVHEWATFSWKAERDELRAANPDPSLRDPEAWFYLSVSDYPALSIIKVMDEKERAELRARVLARR